jgi:hypothetical protein
MTRSCVRLIAILILATHANAAPATQPLQITQQRCDELLAAMPSDPWPARKEASVLAWTESTVVASLLDLYVTTHHRKYLDELVRRGDQILSHRDDVRGFKDHTGRANKRWSIATKYTCACATLKDANGKPVIEVQSTPLANNHVTKLVIAQESNGLIIRATNRIWKRDEMFAQLSLDPKSDRFVEKVINSETPLAKPPPGEATSASQLIRVKVVATEAGTVAPVSVTLGPMWYAHVGYVGIIYHPMLEFAKLVRSDESLKEYRDAALRYVTAAEESYAEIADHWHEGPNAGEGFYIGSPRGGAMPYDNVGEPFNYLAKHACSELALHQLTGKPQYKDHAVRIATLLKNRLQLRDGDLYVWKYWYEPLTTGWKREDNLSDHYPSHPPYTVPEDSSHATLDIAMILSMHEAGLVFDDRDVRRFANTFLKNVVHKNRDGFNAAVDGSGDNDQFEGAAVSGWVPLTSADPAVYDACRDVYLNRGKEDFKSIARLLRWNPTNRKPE